MAIGHGTHVHKVTIQRKTTAQDRIGGASITWTNERTWECFLQPAGESEQTFGAQRGQFFDVTAYGTTDPEMNETTQIVFNGAVYEFVSAQNSLNLNRLYSVRLKVKTQQANLGNVENENEVRLNPL